MSRVGPIHTPDSPQYLVVNYRPISLTNILCKILQPVLNTNLMKHLESHSLLNSNQRGFRQGVSCEAQLTKLIHEESNTVSSHSGIDCVFIYFGEAFDLARPALLVHKTGSMSINKTVHFFFCARRRVSSFWGARFRFRFKRSVSTIMATRVIRSTYGGSRHS